MEQQVLGILEAALLSTSNEETQRVFKTIESAQHQNGYCEALCRISLEQSISFDIRHLATIMLRSMIEKNWGLSDQPIQKQRLEKERAIRREFEEEDDDGKVIESSSSKDHERIRIPEDEKKRLRVQLINGLHLPEMKMKIQYSVMIGVLVKYDFPHQMPDLLSYLIKQIQEHTSGEQGASLCLEMIIHPDFLFDTNQMQQSSQELMPFLLHVYQNSNDFSDATRKSMVMIFFSILNWIVNRLVQREHETDGMMPFLQSVLPHWISQFSNDLINSTSTPLRICILQVMCLLVYSMPQTLIEKNYIQSLFSNSWKLFASLQNIYQEGYIYSDNLHETSTNDIDFNTGNVYFLENLILLLLEFFHALLDKQQLTPIMFSSVPETTYLLVRYMQLSENQLETFEFEEDQFAISEQEQRYGFSALTVRSSSGKLFTEMLSRYKSINNISVIDKALEGIAIQLQETKQSYEKSPYGWKLREAALYACAKGIRYFLNYNSSFVESFPNLLSSICDDLKSNISPFLCTRAYLLFCKSLKFMPSLENIPVDIFVLFHQL